MRSDAEVRGFLHRIQLRPIRQALAYQGLVEVTVTGQSTSASSCCAGWLLARCTQSNQPCRIALFSKEIKSLTVPNGTYRFFGAKCVNPCSLTSEGQLEVHLNLDCSKQVLAPYRAWEGGKEQAMVDICAGIGTHALVAGDLCLCPVGLFDKDQEALQAASLIRREFLPAG